MILTPLLFIHSDTQLCQYMRQSCDVIAALVRELPHIEPREEMLRRLRYTHFGAQDRPAR